MATTFNENQVQQLKRIWSELRGLDRLAGGFVIELQWYVENSPKLITDSNQAIEQEERETFGAVAEQCVELIKTLKRAPSIDRLNILSLREERPEYDGRSLPICDPLLFVEEIQERAASYAEALRHFKKHDRQLYGLKKFLNRFPPARNISKRQFLDLAGVIYQDENDTNESVSSRIYDAVKRLGCENL